VELIMIMRRNSIDIVQSHLLGSNLYCSLAAMMCGVPVVSTFHGFVDVNAKERFSAIKSKIINCGSNKIVFVSDRLRNFFVEKKGFSAQKSVTIYNGVDVSLFKPQRDVTIRKKLGLGPDNVLVGAVGNIRPSKGYEYLLKSAKLVVDRFPQFRFVVAGEGSGKLFANLLDLRKSLGLENHFSFLGFEPDVPRFLNNLDIFVLPSISEGFSISTIEAMACGVPVIVTFSGGPEEIVENELTGIIVTAGDHCSLAKAIIYSFENYESNDKSISALQTCSNKFSISKMINNYEKVYQQITEKV
jgi:glycosyltransferase involved in cell wall biosynthesis